ncbi:MAG: ribosomal protein bL12 [Candidatus Hodgkinia cicadicola]
MSQISEIVKLIGELKLIQLVDLVRELEQMFKIHTSLPAQTNCSKLPVDTKVTVSLDAIGSNKINVIKEIRAILELGLKESKDFVENVPKVVKSDLTASEASELKRRLEKVGASVSLK